MSLQSCDCPPQTAILLLMTSLCFRQQAQTDNCAEVSSPLADSFPIGALRGQTRTSMGTWASFYFLFWQKPTEWMWLIRSTWKHWSLAAGMAMQEWFVLIWVFFLSLPNKESQSFNFKSDQIWITVASKDSPALSNAPLSDLEWNLWKLISPIGLWIWIYNTEIF